MTPFTPVSRGFLERADLSPETRLVAVYLDTFGPGWTVREAQITTALGIGRRAYQRAIRELKAADLMRDGGLTRRGVKPPAFEGRNEVRGLGAKPGAQSLSHVSRPITHKESTLKTTTSLSAETRLRDTAPVPDSPSRAIAPLRVKVPDLQPKALKAHETTCPLGCDTLIPQDADVQWAEEHLKTLHPAAQGPQGDSGTPGPSALAATLPKPETSPRLTAGPSGKRWYECEECGGQFEYLRRGGTCRECEAAIGG